MLIDIATEELSHLEVIGSIVAMLNRGAKGTLAEASKTRRSMYRSITGAGNDSHLTQVLYGGGPSLTNSAACPGRRPTSTAIGDPTVDLRSNIAAEARAKIIYERLINLTDDPGVNEALGFLMTREIAHQKSFEKALYASSPTSRSGKLPGDPRFTNVYFDMSQGGGEVAGPWNRPGRLPGGVGARAAGRGRRRRRHRQCRAGRCRVGRAQADDAAHCVGRLVESGDGR